MPFSAAHWWMDSRTTNLQVNGHDTVFGTHTTGWRYSIIVTNTSGAPPPPEPASQTPRPEKPAQYNQ